MTIRTIGLSNELHDYLLQHSLHEPPALRRLREATSALDEGNWQTAPEQSQFMALLVEILGARRLLEVGTFTGYTTLRLALALPEGGTIITCEVEERFANIGRDHWREAGVADKIDLRMGPALATLDKLIADGSAGSFDMAFIDADKPPYPDYYERCLTLVRRGGLVLIDNVLWSGSVLDTEDRRGSTKAIRRLNQLVHADDRVHMSMLPISDGLTMARKIV